MPRTLVIGAGVGGLAASIDLARQGHEVTLVERAPAVGGKMRRQQVDGQAIDGGPTVLTMRSVFDGLLRDAGVDMGAELGLVELRVMARHLWADGTCLDLFTDLERSAAAIEACFGRRACTGYRRFCDYAERIWNTVRGPFMDGPRPTLMDMVAAMGWRGLAAARHIDFRRTMWAALGHFFEEPKLRQLFARYATYYGSDPFRAPATLNLISHVERSGVWAIEGGMYELARLLERTATQRGVRFEFEAHVEELEIESGRVAGARMLDGRRISADAVVLNAEPAALASGCFGDEAAQAVDGCPRERRSFSALTWAVSGEYDGRALSHHNVFFSDDYAREFEELSRDRTLPSQPTVYVCAQHVSAADERGLAQGAGRLLVLVNAPADGDIGKPSPEQVVACQERTFAHLATCGLHLSGGYKQLSTSPTQFEGLFPGTGGALYGPATHGWRAAFGRPASRTKIHGLYLAGGGVHPGAGVPLAAMSGRLAARAVAEDLGTTSA